MAVTFPATKRYFVSFRNSDTGYAVSFKFYKRADTFAVLTAPAIVELSNGTYYFDITYATQTDPNIIFEIDGTAAIPTEEVRYQTGMAGPSDLFLDEPISQVVDDVWNEPTSAHTIAGSAGKQLIDIPGKVWDETALSHSIAGSTGKALTDINSTILTISTDTGTVKTIIELLQKYEQGRWKVHSTGPDANRLVIYDTDTVTPLIKFDLKNAAGAATSTDPFERVKVP